MSSYYDLHIKEISEIMLTSHGVNQAAANEIINILGNMSTYVQTLIKSFLLLSLTSIMLIYYA